MEDINMEFINTMALLRIQIIVGVDKQIHSFFLGFRTRSNPKSKSPL